LRTRARRWTDDSGRDRGNHQDMSQESHLCA
jgi:hypothetical protein